MFFKKQVLLTTVTLGLHLWTLWQMVNQLGGLLKLWSKIIIDFTCQIASYYRSQALLMFQSFNIQMYLTSFGTLKWEFLQFIEHKLVKFMTNVHLFTCRTISILLDSCGNASFAKRCVATVALLGLVEYHLANVTWVLSFKWLIYA